MFDLEGKVTYNGALDYLQTTLKVGITQAKFTELQNFYNNNNSAFLMLALDNTRVLLAIHEAAFFQQHSQKREVVFQPLVNVEY